MATETLTELNARLNDMITAGRSRSQQFREMNEDAVRYCYGDQHKGRNRKKNWEYPVLNQVYGDIQQEVAVLTGNNPIIAALPMEDTDTETAKLFSDVLSALWKGDSLNMRIKIIEGVYDDHLFGIKVCKWYWEPKAEWNDDLARKTGNGWKGEIRTNIIHPDFFGCDPNVDLAVEIPTKAEYLHTERWVSKQWAANHWEKYKKYLKDKGEEAELTGPVSGGGGGGDDETGFSQSTKEWRGKETGRHDDEYLQSRLADVMVSHMNDTSSTQDNADSVLVQEIYFRDYAEETVKAEYEPVPAGEGEASHIQKGEDGRYYDHEGLFAGEWPQRETRTSYKRPKYPTGRMIVRLDEKEELHVQDVAWPYKRWPFAVSPGVLLPHLWFGSNAVELMRDNQDWMNTIGCHLTNYIKFFGDPQTWIEEGALAKDKDKKKGTLPNWAGAIVVFAKNALTTNRARRESPPPLPGSLFQIFELFRRNKQDTSGNQDVSQGRASKGDNTLGEIEMLNRNAQQRIALQGAMLDVWLKQIAIGLSELMTLHYKVGDWVRLAGPGREAAQSSMQWTQGLVEARYDIDLEPASTLPYDKDRETMKYIKAYDLAPPDVKYALLEELLKKLEIKNIPAIMQKSMLAKQLMELSELTDKQGMPPEQVSAAIQKLTGGLQELESEMPPAILAGE